METKELVSGPCQGSGVTARSDLPSFQVKHAESIGVDAVAVVAPTYFKPVNLSKPWSVHMIWIVVIEMVRVSADLVDYCAEAAKEAPKTPFLYYHIPGQTGINSKNLKIRSLPEVHTPFRFSQDCRLLQGSPRKDSDPGWCQVHVDRPPRRGDGEPIVQ